MNHKTNWKPDPYGNHEFRFFSSDGKPTLLVMDGGKTSYDKPPHGEPPVSSELQPFAPDQPAEVGGPTPDSQSRPPLLVPAPKPTPKDFELPNARRSIEKTAVLTSSGPVTGKSRLQPATSIAHVITDVHTSDAELEKTEPIGRPLKIAFGVVLGVLAVSALAFIYVHVRHTAPDGSTRKMTAATTTLPKHPATTTLALPSLPKPSAETAAMALISSWSTNNKPAALTVATSAAVSTLFAATYNSGLAIDRGCSTLISPIVCTFGPPGGASPTDPIYQVLVSQSSGGWYVSSVKIQN